MASTSVAPARIARSTISRARSVSVPGPVAVLLNGELRKPRRASVISRLEVHATLAVLGVLPQLMLHVRCGCMGHMPAQQLHLAVAILATENGVVVFHGLANRFGLPEERTLPAEN